VRWRFWAGGSGWLAMPDHLESRQMWLYSLICVHSSADSGRLGLIQGGILMGPSFAANLQRTFTAVSKKSSIC
jgi:hypothetical protein